MKKKSYPATGGFLVSVFKRRNQMSVCDECKPQDDLDELDIEALKHKIRLLKVISKSLDELLPVLIKEFQMFTAYQRAAKPQQLGIALLAYAAEQEGPAAMKEAAEKLMAMERRPRKVKEEDKED